MGALTADPLRIADYGLSVFDLGVPVIETYMLKPGEVVVLPPSDLMRQTIVAHPLAVVWMTYEKDGEEVVAREAQRWISGRIEQMAAQAVSRIDSMHRHQSDFRLAHG